MKITLYLSQYNMNYLKYHEVTKKIRGNLLKINHTFPENSHGANEVWVCIFWFVFPTLCSIYYISAACNKGHIQM